MIEKLGKLGTNDGLRKITAELMFQNQEVGDSIPSGVYNCIYMVVPPGEVGIGLRTLT